MPRTWLDMKTMSPSGLVAFFDAYLERWNFTKADARERMFWWAMFYTWRDGGWWYEDEKLGDVKP